MSLFVIADPTPHFHFFAEIEYADAVTIGRGGASSRDATLTAERLSVDLRWSDALNLRAGILLTPVGRWNPIHAAPLVWTTSRPLTTEVFDPNLTGIMLFGTVFPRAGALTYTLFDQFAPPLEDHPEFDPADHSAGGRLELTIDPSWSIATSDLAARRHGDWRQLAGANLLWSHRVLEVMGEVVIADVGGVGAEWGGYLQAVLALTERLSLVERYEHFVAPGRAPSDAAQEARYPTCRCIPRAGVAEVRARTRLRISGRVQGVWYRGATQAEARKLGVDGWVRNLPDGSVEALIEGDADAVRALVDWCRTGPSGARVASIQAASEPVGDDLAGFEIRS